MQLPTPRCPQLISLLPELSAAGCQNGCNCRGQASWAMLLPVPTTRAQHPSNMLGTTSSAPNQPSPHIGKKNTSVNTSAFATKFRKSSGNFNQVFPCNHQSAVPQQYAWYHHISSPNQPSPHIRKKNTLVNTSAFATNFTYTPPGEISENLGRVTSPSNFPDKLPRWEISENLGRVTSPSNFPGGKFQNFWAEFTFIGLAT